MHPHVTSVTVMMQIQSQPERGMLVRTPSCWMLPGWEGLGGMDWLVSRVCHSMHGLYGWKGLGGMGLGCDR